MGNFQSNGGTVINADEIHAHYDYFYFNYIAMRAAYAGIFLWEYYSLAWMNFVYVFGFPGFMIELIS